MVLSTLNKSIGGMVGGSIGAAYGPQGSLIGKTVGSQLGFTGMARLGWNFGTGNQAGGQNQLSNLTFSRGQNVSGQHSLNQNRLSAVGNTPQSPANIAKTIPAPKPKPSRPKSNEEDEKTFGFKL